MTASPCSAVAPHIVDGQQISASRKQPIVKQHGSKCIQIEDEVQSANHRRRARHRARHGLDIFRLR